MLYLHRLRRHPFGFWLLTFLLAGLTAAAVLRAGAAAEGWGPTVPVVVMARPVEPGSVVAAADVRVVEWPARVAPGEALRSAAEAVGRVAVVSLAPGEPVVRRRLAPDGLVGVAALVPPGYRAVALPVDGPALALRVGDRVDVLATFESEPTVVVVESVPVVAVADPAEADGAVTVAVPASTLPRLAYATTRATLTIALSTSPGDVDNAEDGAR